MLHPVDYRLSKNKFWLSTWNSYSLKNYRNLILNDKILNILGYIFKNCFKSSYAFASPWSNPRKNRKYFSNFVIGFDGRRAIRTGPNKVKKLPGFIIPEDYHIIRFSNFIVLKIYFLIDRNLETYWAKKQKNWRSPIKYFNMRYNKNKNKENVLRFSKNLFISNTEKKNFKSTGFFMYLINLLNNNYIKKSMYLNFSDQDYHFKKDRRHTLSRFYDNNFKLLNKVRNSFFLFYLSNKNSTIVQNKNILSDSKSNIFKNLYFKTFNNCLKNPSKKKQNLFKVFSFDYNTINKLASNYTLNSKNYLFTPKSISYRTHPLSLPSHVNLSEKIVKNKIALKSFITFSFFIQKNCKKLFNFSTNLHSSVKQLFLTNNINKLFSNKDNILVYNANSYFNKGGYQSSLSILDFKFWLKNIYTTYNNLKINKYSRSNLIKPSKIFYSNLNSKKKMNKFYVNLNKRRLPLLYFQGFSSNQNLTVKKNRSHLLKPNKVRHVSYFNVFNTNSLQKFSFKSKKFLEFFILNNRLKFLNKNNHFINTLDIEKNYLFFSKNLFNTKTKTHKYSKKYNEQLLSFRLTKLNKSIAFNFLSNSKLNFLNSTDDKNLSLGLHRLKLSISNNKWSNLFKILNLKSSIKFSKSKVLKSKLYSNQSHSKFISSMIKISSLDSLNFLNKFFLKKQIRSHSIFKNSLNSSISEKNSIIKNDFPLNNKSLFIKNKILSNRFLWGNTILRTTNFNKSNNYNFFTKEHWNFLPLKSKFLLDKIYLKKKIKSSILEYKPFLNIMQYQYKGFNSNSNSNLNFVNGIYTNYFLFSNKKLFNLKKTKSMSLDSLSVNSSKIITFKESIWELDKNYKVQTFFNFYYKKTFSRILQKKDAHSKDDIFQIELRLNSSRVHKSNKLLKFKPYSMKSVSRVQRFKNHGSILDTYVKKLVKRNYLFDFYDLMESKKFIFKKNLSYKSFKLWEEYMLKAKGGIILKNINNSSFNYSKVVDYSLNSFVEKLNWLKFFNKKIKKIESDPFRDLKKKKEKYLFDTSDLFVYNSKYNQIIKKVQFKYFKRKRWASKFDNGLYINKIIIKPYKPLLLFKTSYNKISDKINYFSSFYKKFESHTFKNFDFPFSNFKTSYKYRMLNYNYFWNNKITNMQKLFLKVHTKHIIPSFVSFVFKKNITAKTLVFNKSNNLSFNKYLKSKLSNFFLPIKSLEKFKKNSKVKKEDLDLRIYGLGVKLASPRIKFIDKKKRMDKLQPKTFLYWNHLKWFNLFIKNFSNTKFNKFNNFQVTFKVYESFKNINFNYYKNTKKSISNINPNKKPPSSLVSINFKTLQGLIYYKTLFKSKKSFLYSGDFKVSHNKQLLLSWIHDIRFLTSKSKRLNYIPHIRYRALKNSTYMWRINTRKLDLLTKYYKSRSRFYKNKLNFVSKNLSKSSIISYLRLMDSNFARIRKSMQRDLPLISTKRYLQFQLKKLNSYLKLLLKRRKKRHFLRSQRKNPKTNAQSLKWTRFYESQFKKEKEMLPIKLFNFSKKRFHIEKKNLIDYVKNFIEHLFLIIFKFNNLRVFYIKKYQMNVMGTKAKLFKNLFNYRLATGFKIPFLVKVICKKLNYDKSLVGCKIGFFGRYSKKLRNRKIWRYVRHIKPSVISTPLDYYNILILQKWGITGIKLSMLRKKTFNFIFN